MHLAVILTTLWSLASTAHAWDTTRHDVKEAHGYPSLTDTSEGRTSNVSWACVWNYAFFYDGYHIRGVNWGVDVDEETLKKAVRKGGLVTDWNFITWVSRGEYEFGDSVWIEPGSNVFHADFHLPINHVSKMSKGVREQILEPKGIDGDDFHCLELSDNDFEVVPSYNNPGLVPGGLQ